VSLVGEFDSATLAKAHAIASMTEFHGGRLRVEDDGELQEFHPDFHRASNAEYFQIWTSDGKTMTRSDTLKDADLAQVDPKPMAKAVSVDVVLPDGRDGRQLVMPFEIHAEEDESPNPAPAVILAVARSRGELDRMLGRFRWLLALVCGCATIAMLGMTAIVIGRGLRPVNVVAGRISALGETNLSHRLADSDVPPELAPIVHRLNELLGRLNAAFEREKSFTADAAHELRTPLAGLEAALDVCAKKVRAPEKYAEVVTDCLAVVRGMHGMVENLLMLARADAAQILPNLTDCAIDEFLTEAWRPFGQRARERSLNVKWQVQPGLIIKTDRERLFPVLTNLFDNAVRYANQGGDVRISAAKENASAVIQIANTGSRVRSEDAAHVFERFWRADPSRTAASTSCGLGLSVCQKMIAVLHGTISAESTEGGEFEITIRFT
jgi:signal transduction histidine kinase